MMIWLTSDLTQNFFYNYSSRKAGVAPMPSQIMCERVTKAWGLRSWKIPASMANWRSVFIFSFSLPHWIPAFHNDHGYIWTSFVYTKILSLQKAQEGSQETGRNEGRLQTLKLVSQNCQLETYRMTLKSPRLSQSLKCKSNLASLKAPTESWQRSLRKATA